MLDYGTPVVSGVTPGKGGQWTFNGRVPVFDTVAEAIRETGANTSVIYVPAAFAPDAMLEAASAGIGLIFCITEGIPALDMLRLYHVLHPAGCPAHRAELPRRHVRRPGQGRHHPGQHPPARTGGRGQPVGHLTYEVVQALTDEGIGQSTCVGIGGDPIVGTSFIEVLDLFEADPTPRRSSSSGRSAAMRRSGGGPYRRAP